MVEDVVYVDFEKFVLFVDGFFEFLVNMESFCNVVYVCVDYDGICVIVNDL